ncbi:substrate-binding domain-containing protein [Microbacterium sp. PRC9]|uniref:LacI family DNA-binding transcriptional regulator n=1 Tax=Microbacterium sp. PRC9 TaxID=2962591 RepID=UPI002881434D|nr:substrate-binding domain-containing protein [Microbacterium sp. PRC9]MDT0141037.1 substrate-binding domain-containing protein [Microbacterium sp. PRC9]
MDDSDAAPGARVGVRDVARAAGVSTQTVSRVINQHPNIRPETRDRVLRVIDDLGYRVNNAARTLGTRTTRTLGVIASDATLYGPAVGIAALEAAARDAGRWIATAYADASVEASVRDAADRLLAQGVDGLIVLAPHAATLTALTDAHPGVAIAALHTGSGAERQEAGAALAISHLVALGHRRIGRVAGPGEWLEARSREAGMLRALADAGVEPGPRWSGDWTAADGAALAPAIVAEVRTAGGPTAIAAANDQMALGLIAGLREAGVDVPGDVSIVGFDDNPDAAYYRPALTTVGLDLRGEARRAVAEVLGEAASVPAPPRLVVRASTAPPR